MGPIEFGGKNDMEVNGTHQLFGYQHLLLCDFFIVHHIKDYRQLALCPNIPTSILYSRKYSMWLRSMSRFI